MYKTVNDMASSFLEEYVIPLLDHHFVFGQLTPVNDMCLELGPFSANVLSL